MLYEKGVIRAIRRGISLATVANKRVLRIEIYYIPFCTSHCPQRGAHGTVVG
jgi:hypothetical protein